MSDDLRLRWADFPTDEYHARVESAQRLMAEQSIDVLLLAQQENVEYFSGFQTGHWNLKSFPTAVVLLHRTKDPVLVLPQFFAGNAHTGSWVDQLVTVPEPHADPRAFGPTVTEAIRELAGTSATVGLERGTHLVPNWNLEDYEYVKANLVSADFVSGADVIWGTRTIKSVREIERMQWLTRLTDRAIQSARHALEPGWTEVQVAAHIQREMVANGADGVAFRNIRAGADRYACSDSLPQERSIGEGEILLIDTGATYKTYATDVAYITHIGKATAEHHHQYDVIISAHEAALEAAKPGVPAKEVYFAARRVLDDSTLRTLDMIGHGIGMDVHEPPMLTPYDETPLKPGMMFAVEPWLYDSEGMGLFCVEEIVLVTEEGAEVISSIDRDELMEVY